MLTMKTRVGFSSSLGFTLAAAGSAIGLGNLWRFPYLAARGGGGLFLLIYVLLVFTFGFTLMTVEIAIGRKTQIGPLQAYGHLNKRFTFLGWICTAIPILVLPYYSVIGGWIVQYATVYLFGNGQQITNLEPQKYFSLFLSDGWTPLLCFAIFLLFCAVVVIFGIQKGVEKFSKIIMPVLLVLVLFIALYSLTLSYTDENGNTRNAWEGLQIYLIPNFEGVTLKSFLSILMDAVGQLFYSLGVGMGLLIAYGSYLKRDSDMITSVGQIELFDTGVALLAGAIMIPSVYVFQGREGLSASGPSLLFVSLPSIFEKMGPFGGFVGALFFLLVFFAAATSAISLLETMVTALIDRFSINRITATIACTCVSLLIGSVICIGFVQNWQFSLLNGISGSLLDMMDYFSNNILLPLIGIASCILVGWILPRKWLIEEISQGRNGKPIYRKKLLFITLRYIAPILLLVLLLQGCGIFG